MAEGLGASPFVFEKENLGQTPTKADGAVKTPGSVSVACAAPLHHFPMYQNFPAKAAKRVGFRKRSLHA